MHDSHTTTIVLVEDNPGHALLIEKCLRRAGIVNPIKTLMDAGAAGEFLFGHEGDSDNLQNRPLLVLLDLNVAALDGYQMLERLKSDERTRHIPVMILTSTDKPQELARCYELGCNVCVTKPTEEDRFADAIWKLGMFLSILKVPEAVENDG